MEKLVNRFQKRRKNALVISQQADQQIEKLLLRRFERLVSVRRFVFLWVGLFVIIFFTTFIQFMGLSRYYQNLQPVPGGFFSAGLIGSFTNANPVYSSGTVDVAVSRLVFSGLFKYDTNNNLTGDLASSYTLDSSQKHYTVHLRKDVTWHDGQPFTADDVLFTYQTIQTLSAQSPLYASWRDIKVAKQDTYTVTFDLPNLLSSFPYALTNGIAPAHLLQKIPPEQLRSASFNTKPVGTGPFVWRFVEVSGVTPETRRQRITLAAYKNYWQGKPKLDGFSLLTFNNEDQMLTAFKKKEINAMGGLETIPEDLLRDDSVQIHVTPLTSSVMAFFNNSRPILNSANVRKALISGVDRRKIPTLTPYPTRSVDEPFLKGQLGYDPSFAELPYNFDYANQLLDQDGWVKDPTGQRSKAGTPLAFSLSSQDAPDYTVTAKFLQEEWAKLGVKVTVHYYSGDELQSNVIANHDYDALLYGISIGVDPDVFAYWDSSQASVASQGHLNLSEYKSAAADQALQAGRTRSDPNLRVLKYKAFLKAWDDDAPALALYQPNYTYITRGPVFNYDRKADNSSADRFYNVNNWMIRQKRQTID
ncbi:MAG TPA: peptide ABC transporter substrate-binding protein [Candidatus Saccharimonadales bacterium]|nr:peptide ABC transporter substrate-binding protein [Candidatus Saccharimonadales bacterium]